MTTAERSPTISARIGGGDRTVRDRESVPGDRPAVRVPVLHRANVEAFVSSGSLQPRPDPEVEAEEVVRCGDAAFQRLPARDVERASLRGSECRS